MSSLIKAKPFLNWHYRMGKHESVHMNPYNRFIHWFCIPCQIFSTCLVFSSISLNRSIVDNGALTIPVNLSLFVIAGLCALYSYMDVIGGILTILLWTPLLCCANFIHHNSLLGDYEIVVGLLLFVSTFSVQVGVGHFIFEEGRDDTEQNIGEFLATWNPIYISCIPFYHHMEIVFNMGLRKEVCAIVQSHQRAE